MMAIIIKIVMNIMITHSNNNNNNNDNQYNTPTNARAGIARKQKGEHITSSVAANPFQVWSKRANEYPTTAIRRLCACPRPAWLPTPSRHRSKT